MPLSRPTSYYMPLPRPTSYYMPISCLNIHSRSRNPNQKTIYTDNKKFILLSKVCLYTLYIFMYVFLSRYNLLLSLYISPYIYIYTLYLPISPHFSRYISLYLAIKGLHGTSEGRPQRTFFIHHDLHTRPTHPRYVDGMTYVL